MIQSERIGGADRDRTDDLHNAIVALFQLSYGPVKFFSSERLPVRRDQTNGLIIRWVGFCAREGG